MLHRRKGEGDGEDSFTAAARADSTPHLSPLPFPKGRGETKSVSMKKRAAQLQSRLRFSVFQPIDGLWDNGTVFETNASEGELIYSARRQHSERVRRDPRQASSAPRRSRTRRSSFGFDRDPVRSSAFTRIGKRTP